MGDRYEMVGTRQDLSKKPVSSPASNPKGGATHQLVGDSLALSRKSIQSPSANPRTPGKAHMVGTSVDLNRTPVKGWGKAANLPMSERSHEQSMTAATSRGKRKR